MKSERDIEDFLCKIEDDDFVINESLKPNHLRIKTLEMCIEEGSKWAIKNKRWDTLVSFSQLETLAKIYRDIQAV